MGHGLLHRLTEADLDRSFLVPKEPPGGTRTSWPRSEERSWPLVEEELQHRGELNALLWQINLDPPIWIGFLGRRRCGSPRQHRTDGESERRVPRSERLSTVRDWNPENAPERALPLQANVTVDSVGGRPGGSPD